MPTSPTSMSEIRSATGSSTSVRPSGPTTGWCRSTSTAPCRCGNDFAGQWAGDSIDAAGRLGSTRRGKYAFDDDDQAGGIPGSGAMRWDIHDDKTTASNHAGRTHARRAQAASTPWTTASAVARLISSRSSVGYSAARIRRAFHGWPVRPDPAVELAAQRRGKLNQDDAPMPPLRVDVRLAAGSVGGLAEADKDDIYVRDQSVSDDTAHNLYAPFYQAFIPAALAADDGETSGVAGSFANNFPGFQTDFYDYWELLNRWTEDPLRGQNICNDELGNPRWSPTRPRSRRGLHGRARRGDRRVRPGHRVQLRSRLERSAAISTCRRTAPSTQRSRRRGSIPTSL